MILDDLRNKIDNLRNSIAEATDSVKPYIRGGILENFRATAESLGADVNSLLREADVAPEVLDIPGIYLPYANYLRLMDAAARATGAPHFGLEMTRNMTIGNLGIMGLVMSQAQTVGTAWHSFERFYRIHDTYATVKLEQAADRAIISYAIPRNDLPGARQIYDAAAGFSNNIMKQFCGPEFRALGFGFPYAAPDERDCYDKLASEGLRFNTHAMEMHFNIDLLQRELPGGSDEMRLLIDHYFSTVQDVDSHRPVSHQVEDLIRRLLPTGDCTLTRIAETLYMSDRSLQLQLAEEQCSFRELLEKVRREIATYHLRRGDLPLTQLALLLGYSELSAFSRSFRDWYGLSPRQWVARGAWGT